MQEACDSYEASAQFAEVMSDIVAIEDSKSGDNVLVRIDADCQWQMVFSQHIMQSCNNNKSFQLRNNVPIGFNATPNI